MTILLFLLFSLFNPHPERYNQLLVPEQTEREVAKVVMPQGGERNRYGHRAWSRFLKVASPFFRSEQRWQALGLLGLLIALLFGVSGLNVFNSYVGRDFMTAVADRNATGFQKLALVYIVVFVLSTLVATFYRYTEEKLGLSWRDWLTRYITDRYLARHAYYHIQGQGDIDNPDQRIAEDVRTFTATTLSFVLIFLNSAITLCAFSGILWSITPWLLVGAVGYAACGSLLTILLGRRLVGLNVLRLKQEADLRYELIRIRENAEPIALLRGEPHGNARVCTQLQAMVDNLRIIIGINRNLGFFTAGYSYLTQLIPLLIVAPLFIAGKIEFGAVTQSAMAFGHVLGAFSLIVTEFQRISGFAADIERLGSLCETLEDIHAPRSTDLTLDEEDERIAFEQLTLHSSADGRILVRDLHLEVPQGNRVYIQGPQGAGPGALLRAAAGLWRDGSGRIIRPSLEDVLFLPQRPFLAARTLREQLLSSVKEHAPETRLLAVLRELGLEPILERTGGLDGKCDWSSVLSLGDQQLVAAAGLLLANPRFAFLDEATSALDATRARRLYEALARSGITYLSTGSDPSLMKYHDLLLKVNGDGTWATASGTGQRQRLTAKASDRRKPPQSSHHAPRDGRSSRGA